MTRNLKQNKNKGRSLLNKGTSFIYCGTPEYTLVVYLPIELYKRFLTARYVEQIRFQKNRMWMMKLLKIVFRK